MLSRTRKTLTSSPIRLQLLLWAWNLPPPSFPKRMMTTKKLEHGKARIDDSIVTVMSGEKECNYRSYVGNVDDYDIQAAEQFKIMTSLGLRDCHKLLDIGCGSLRAGRVLIPYLQAGNYFGIEPNEWLLEESMERELGRDILRIKNPTFIHTTDFAISEFKQKFDFFMAFSILSHTSQAQTRKCFAQVAAAMEEHSLFVFTFVEGEENYTGEEWVYPGVSTYTFEMMQKMAGESGLNLERLDYCEPGYQTRVVAFKPAFEQKLLDTLNKSPIFKTKGDLQARFNTVVLENNSLIAENERLKAETIDLHAQLHEAKTNLARFLSNPAIKSVLALRRSLKPIKRSP
jgi:cyclopropane fatty-acyl-phospholipid synthase-like methyltransferase